ncbi:uncharacterized protein LOC130998608 [Salvia miltiorrhiza]|uniref:uncharacterized protein LOC130998608 n=1 Tax=Salvia miltiorrhiza TaxID=226208 RepID=UPI0025ABD68B|nr:uncharacterized protein LOC130998608 [Salvia miltiorrhiza]
MDNVNNIGFSHEKKSKWKSKSHACHYCSTPYHIKPYCVKCLSDVDDLSAKQTFDSFQRNVSNISRFDFGEMSNTEKDDEPCNVIYIFLHTNISDCWYFDSGCSRYMTGSKALLTDYVSTNGGNITFRAGMLVKFDKNICEVFDNINQCVMMCRTSSNICYKSENGNICNVVKLSNVELQHQRLNHVNLKNFKKLIANDVVRGLPKFVIKRDVACQPCQKGQQLRTAYPMLSTCNTTRCLELLHRNLMSHVEVESLGGERYVLVCDDDYSKYTLVAFMKAKSETFYRFEKLYKMFVTQYELNVGRISLDHGKEFENLFLDDVCTNHCSFYEYSALKTFHQTSVSVRKHMILQEMVKAMLHAKSLSKCSWSEAVKTAYHTINRGYLRPDDEDRSVLLEEQKESEQTSEQQRNVNVDPTSDVSSSDSTSEPELVENTSDPDDEHGRHLLHDSSRRNPLGHVRKNHMSTQLIGDVLEQMQTRKRKEINHNDMVRIACMCSACETVEVECYLSIVEPRNVTEALNDVNWVNVMLDVLNQFVRNDVWDLVPRPHNKNVIGTKWIFKNKTDVAGNIVRNKARLIAHSYTQVEGIDFDETFAHVARIESIRLLFAITCQVGISLLQMDIKSAFLNGVLTEEAYVEQPKGF